MVRGQKIEAALIFFRNGGAGGFNWAVGLGARRPDGTDACILFFYSCQKKF